jgi:perosamine synthetase
MKSKSTIDFIKQSFGSTYKGKQACALGAIGVFSFNGNKIVPCGGGAIVTNNPVIAKKAKYVTTTAKVPHKWKYIHDDICYNFRMPNLNVALACVKLEQLDKMLESKQHLAEV